MSVISSSLRNLSSFLQDHQASFSSGLLILFTIGGEQIFRFNAFQCPCSQPEAKHYALVFMFIPAAVLGIMGVIVSNLTWRVWHGCCKRTKTYEHGLCKASERIIEVIVRAAIVPGAWLFVTLLDGNYYACMRSTQPCVKDSPEYKNFTAESQNISWYALLAVVLFAFSVMAIVRCCDSVTYVQYKYISFYREAERNQLDILTKEHADQLAKKNVEDFIQEPVLLKEDWDAISVTPDTTISKPDVSSLTPLHEWNKLKAPQVVETQVQTMAV